MTDLSFADFFGEGRSANPYWNESVWFSVSVEVPAANGCGSLGRRCPWVHSNPVWVWVGESGAIYAASSCAAGIGDLR